MNANFTYNAKVTRVVDGDTVVAVVDLGFSIKATMIFRLKGINTPELISATRDAAIRAKDYLAERVEGKDITIKTYKDRKEKYGRYLAELFVDDVNINQQLIIEAYAVADDGKR